MKFAVGAYDGNEIGLVLSKERIAYGARSIIMYVMNRTARRIGEESNPMINPFTHSKFIFFFQPITAPTRMLTTMDNNILARNCICPSAF